MLSVSFLAWTAGIGTSHTRFHMRSTYVASTVTDSAIAIAVRFSTRITREYIGSPPVTSEPANANQEARRGDTDRIEIPDAPAVCGPVELARCPHRAGIQGERWRRGV